MDLIGMDEAGYGPKIGPLVVALSKWRFSGIGEDCEGKKLDHYLRQAFALPAGSSGPGDQQKLVPIADSKQVYRCRKDLFALEQGVLPLLQLAGWQGHSFRSLLNFSDPTAGDASKGLPWLADYDVPIPRAAAQKSFSAAAWYLRERFTQLQIQLVEYRARIIFEPEFNRRLRQWGNKAETLWQVGMELLGESVLNSCSSRVVVLADRQGGRVYYGSLLSRFGERLGLRLDSVLQESPMESAYRFQREGGSLEIWFSVKGERFLAVAAASMLAKYLRELVLEAFNRFWRERIPTLRPTEGYPADAKRFKAEITGVQERLCIPEDFFWRER